MNPIFSEFLNTLADSDLHAAYLKLPETLPEDKDAKIVQALRAICTSHFIRQRGSKLNGLFNLKRSGFNPSLVIDVGAQVGTPELFNAFPDAHHIFIEPVNECIPILQDIAKQLRSAEVIHCAVSNTSGTTSLSVTPSRQYSSIEKRLGEESREIAVRTVDSIYDDTNASGPILLKIDVDGIELKVLQGSLSVLHQDCVVIVEASIADEQPRFHGVVDYLSKHGYDVYDIVDPLYRQSDWHLWQVDLVFMKTSSSLWGAKQFI